jgi:hypothetical protein
VTRLGLEYELFFWLGFKEKKIYKKEEKEKCKECV